MEIRNLEHTDFETLYHGFEKAFSDYEIHFDKEEVRSMLTRRGYNPRLSFAAFANGEIAAFTLNGTGTLNGVPTAYDIATGTVKKFRSQRLAGKIFTHFLPFLKSSGIRQYLLEVLQNNTKAIAVYRRMNFKTTREFSCFKQTIEHIDNQQTNTACILEEADANSIRQAQHNCDFIPSWQNCIESIERGMPGLTCIGAFMDGKMVGHCVFDIHTGDLTQIAVRNEYRRKGIASRLLKKATTSMKTNHIKVLNVSSDNPSVAAFLQSKNIHLASKQFEMVLPL